MRRLALAALAAVVVLGGTAVAVAGYVLTRRSPELAEGQRFLDPQEAEAPLAADVDLPVALHAEEVRQPHARVELGTRELRLFGETVGPMPPAGATTLPSAEATTLAKRLDALLATSVISSRTLELAVDREVRFGVVADVVQVLSHGGFRARLFLVKNAAGELRILKPRSVGQPRARVVADARGAHAEARPDGGSQAACAWAIGAPTLPFVDCLDGTEDADAGEARLRQLTMLAILGASSLYDVSPTRDARYGDVIAIVDALAGAGSGFIFGAADAKP